uniref:Uncharacterized protein n=1 Tax=Eutreptiella gymnastica TaxID=73025 RepID=A0A7S1IV70_9EUGL|mmetsp:Transcript_44300/g.79480  ORF Transcript_44300/g.79480 Transcript_44300/m.79480 type:complete len:150 (+) Transcript_44300:138-587(+)
MQNGIIGIFMGNSWKNVVASVRFHASVSGPKSADGLHHCSIVPLGYGLGWINALSWSQLCTHFQWHLQLDSATPLVKTIPSASMYIHVLFMSVMKTNRLSGRDQCDNKHIRGITAPLGECPNTQRGRKQAGKPRTHCRLNPPAEIMIIC